MCDNVRLQLHHTLMRSVVRQDPAVSGNHVLQYRQVLHVVMGVHEMCVSLEWSLNQCGSTVEPLQRIHFVQTLYVRLTSFSYI